MKTTKVVRFDWAMKRFLRTKTSFESLEGFLTTLLEKDVKILQLLEGESNKERREDRSNRWDLLVEMGDGELVLVEVQVVRELDYFRRLVPGASKLVFAEGVSYEKVKRVISVSIVYFDLGQGKDYVYRGETEFRGIHCGDVLGLTDKQRRILPKLVKASEVLPVYYLLKVNEFDDHAKNSLDEWIYFFKNSKVRGEFGAKGLKKAARAWSVQKLDEDAWREYDGYIKDWRIASGVMETAYIEGELDGIEERWEKIGIEEGRKEGKLEGRKEGIEKVAMAMLGAGDSEEKVVALTGLSEEEVRELGGKNCRL